MAEKIEVKPCPFCNEEVYIALNVASGLYRIKCRNTLCAVHPSTDWVANKMESIRRWNTIERQLK